MAESFDSINAPQFFDFNNDVKELDDTCSGYFEQEHELLEDPLNNSDFFSEVTLVADELEDGTSSKQRNFRRSMSVGDLQDIRENLHKLRNGKLYACYANEEEQQVNLTSACSTSTQSLHEEAGSSESFRTESREFINRLAQPKRQFKSDQTLNKTEYVPMAEALIKFQNGTPKRFRTKPNATKEPPLKSTIPQSPKLKTTVRNRPVYALSREEQEQLDLNEAKKYQFKANPVDKKILQPRAASSSREKRSTVPEPFKLTKVSTKTVSESPAKKTAEFHARPVPKSVYKPYQPAIKAPLKMQITKPQTPTFMKKYVTPLKAMQNQTESVQQQQQPKLNPTKPLPFSFELRNQALKSKRDALVQKYLKAEKAAREFHAKPVPKYVLEPSRKMHSNYGSRGSLQSCGKTNGEDNLNSTQFKAKPATVLLKKPFEPVLQNRPLLELADFTLNTDLRARERENFEYRIKEKEEKLSAFRQEEEIRRKQQEEEEILRARKAAEFKAQEIKKYKEVNIQPVKKVTNPISPKFNSNKLRNKSDNKENTL